MLTITITDRALVEFMERAVKFDLGLWRDALRAVGRRGDAALVQAIEHGRSLDTFREAIALAVRRGVECGASAVRYCKLTFRLAGTVVVGVERRGAERRLSRRERQARRMLECAA